MAHNALKELCLEITSSCPMQCIHCSNDDTLQEKLEFYEIKSVIDDFSVLGGQILEISGGEPLEHTDIFKIIRHAKTKGLEIRLYTSGLRSQKGEIVSITTELANELKDSGLDKIIFNIEGSAPTTHELVTGLNGSYKKAVESISVTTSVGLWVGIHFVPIKINFREIKQAIDLGDALGVSEFAVLRFVPQGRGFINREILELSYHELEELFNILNKIKINKQIKIRIGHPLGCFLINDFESSECLAGRSTCLIKPNGDVVPCPAFKQNMDYVAGKINENSLINIWSNSEILKKLRAFKYTNLIGCGSCISLSKCHGGCTAQRILAWGDLYRGSDPECPRSASKAKSNYCVFRPYTRVLAPSSTATQE